MAPIDAAHRALELDLDLIRRHDVAGPRYTSYPTAPEWNEQVNAPVVTAHLDELRGRSREPLSIYLHLPFCIEHCTFCACNVIASPKMEAVSEPYLQTLEREVALWTDHLDTRRPVVQFHWGGGTPTYLNVDQIRRTHALIADRLHLTADAEQSIEVHVSWTSDEQLRALAELGFNRLSLGVQDFNPRTQAAIGRRQTFERTREIVELARTLGFSGINFDLVYGLPHQTVESFSATVERVLDLHPDRLAVYNFAFLPARLAHQRAIDPASLPAADEKLRIFAQAHALFAGAGYRHIGMDHFALPGDELSLAHDSGTMQRNFMGFTTRAGADLVGMGVSAISSIAGLYAQNVKRITAYRQSIDSGSLPIERGLVLNRDDLLRRDVINALMCRGTIEKREIEEKHGIGFDAYFLPELERLITFETDGLIELRPASLMLTEAGQMFVRNIAMVFDAYLKKSNTTPRAQFSRTL